MAEMAVCKVASKMICLVEEINKTITIGSTYQSKTSFLCYGCTKGFAKFAK